MPDRLIVSLDGTWNSPFQPVVRDDGTNVLKPANPLKLARSILPIDTEGNRQITYYDSGVGALGLYPGFGNGILKFVDHKLGGIWGAGFEQNVEQAANFVALNMRPGTDLFVFGFSRGAAQARALARFLNWMGGVPAKADAYYVPIFFRSYLETRGQGSVRDIVNSKGEVIADRIVPMTIRLLGVWDTVMALGARSRATVGTSTADRAFLVGAEPPAIVQHARQALAIDERRYDYRPEIWHGKQPHQTIEQCWFPGVHSNVGGSYGEDGLANGALHWMIDAAKSNGLAVDETFLGKYRPYPQHKLGKTHSLFWRAREALQRKLGQGVRELSGYPQAAGLGLHRSVVQRICANPDEHSFMDEPYRPEEVVTLLEAHRENWEDFVRGLGLDPDRYPFPQGM
jgi:uncharacterized protein (DUF2235 family)